MKIGVFGPHGRLGRWLVAGGADPIDCDITNYKTIVEALGGTSYDVVVNCAAFTSVEDAERKEAQEHVIQVNYKSLTFILAALGLHTHLVHISTDYVFGGKRGPYTERMRFINSDLPVNYYGLSKMSAELALQDFPKVTIVRTTGLFGSGDPDFAVAVWNALMSGDTMSVSDNLWGNQTYIPYLAGQIFQLADMSYKPPVVHLASSDITTRYDFARMIADCVGLSSTCLRPVSSADIWKTPRPVHGGLNVELSKKLGFNQYTIQEGLGAWISKNR